MCPEKMALGRKKNYHVWPTVKNCRKIRVSMQLQTLIKKMRDRNEKDGKISGIFYG